MSRTSSVSLLAFSLVALPCAAHAEGSYRPLPYYQDWSDTTLISANNNWLAVPGVIGYRGDGLVSVDGASPSAIVAAGTGTPVHVLANQSNPNTLTSGGVAEFELSDAVVALQGSSTADAPFLLLHLDTLGWRDLSVSYLLRDVDGSMDNAVQPVAFQYRVGQGGEFINLASAFVADATQGATAGLLTPVSVALPEATWSVPQLQLRFITANAAGGDEWVGIDNISVSGAAVAAVPEPGEWLMMASGLAMLVLCARRRIRA
jgi:hypothetical protein